MGQRGPSYLTELCNKDLLEFFPFSLTVIRATFTQQLVPCVYIFIFFFFPREAFLAWIINQLDYKILLLLVPALTSRSTLAPRLLQDDTDLPTFMGEGLCRHI